MKFGPPIFYDRPFVVGFVFLRWRFPETFYNSLSAPETLVKLEWINDWNIGMLDWLDHAVFVLFKSFVPGFDVDKRLWTLLPFAKT